MRPGMTIDFSPEGCAVQHDTSALHCGMRVTLQLALPDRLDPLEIKHASVIWIKNHQCGIRFLALSPKDQTRINTVYDVLLQAQTEKEESTAPAVITLRLP